MTDSEMLAEILRQVRAIRSYISQQPNCPQHLWDDVRRSNEVLRQAISAGVPYDEWCQQIQRSPIGKA